MGKLLQFQQIQTYFYGVADTRINRQREISLNAVRQGFA